MDGALTEAQLFGSCCWQGLRLTKGGCRQAGLGYRRARGARLGGSLLTANSA